MADVIAIRSNLMKKNQKENSNIAGALDDQFLNNSGESNPIDLTFERSDDEDDIIV